MSEFARRSLLFILASDPRLSARPAEAIRVAAGIGAWRKVDVTVYLHGPAILALGEWVDELKDEDNFTRYLPMLAEFPQPIYAQAGAAALAELGVPSHPFTPLSDVELAGLAARSSSVLRF